MPQLPLAEETNEASMSVNSNKSSSQSGGSFHQVSSVAAASATSLGVGGNKNEKKRKHPTAAKPPPSSSEPSSERVRAVTPTDDLLHPPKRKNKKGGWNAEEDAIIKNAVQNSMLTKSNDLLQALPGRGWAAIRDRWYNDLNPAINRTPFVTMPETRYGPEYRMLWNGYRTLGNFAEISIQIFNGTRSPAQLRNCWNTLHFISFIQSEFGQDAFESIATERKKLQKEQKEQKNGGPPRIKNGHNLYE